MNGTILQYFEWYLPPDAKHWQRTAQQAQSLAAAGITAVWLPPAYKGANGIKDVGYGVYDTYDLGEFDQKGGIPTKYGTKAEYLAAIAALHKAGIQVLADIVLNHRMGADECEQAQATENAGYNRNCVTSGNETISVYTKFSFPGRAGQYSTFQWNKNMRHILDNTLVAANPAKAVTFVDNHDTQPGQALESWVDGWFKPLAYAIILLREGGYPCVFYGDYYGIAHSNIAPVGMPLLAMLKARQTAAHGLQHDYFDHPNVIGWTREGCDEHKDSGLAVMLSDGPGGEKRMFVGLKHVGQMFVPVMGGGVPVMIESDGCAVFGVDGGSARVYQRQV